MDIRGISPPLPRMIVGRSSELAQLKDNLLEGITASGSVVFSREAFRRALESSGLTRGEVADGAGVDIKTINNAENEKSIRDTNANAIARLLRTTVRSLLKLPTTKTVVALHSAPGLGKTTVLQALCHQDELRETLADGTLWAPLGQSPDIPGVLTQWAFSLGLIDISAAKTFGQQNSSELLRSILNAALSDKKVLILIDDAWSAQHVTDLLVGGGGCPVLVTTRHLNVATAIASSSANRILLRRLSDEDSLELLHTLAGPAVGNNLTAASALVAALEGHPLGLQVAGRLIAEHHATGLDATALMNRLKDLDCLLGEPLADANSLSQTVGAVFRISTDALSDTERLCFAFLSSWEAKPAPLDIEMMSESWSPFQVEAEKMAQLLVTRGLLEPLGDGKFWIHSLLAAHGRSILRSMQIGGLRA